MSHSPMFETWVSLRLVYMVLGKACMFGRELTVASMLQKKSFSSAELHRWAVPYI